MRWWIILLNACWLSTVNINILASSDAQSIDALLSVMEEQLEVDSVRQAMVAQRLSALQQSQQIEISPHALTKEFLQKTLNTLMLQEAELSNIELTVKAAQMEVELTQANIQNLQQPNIDIKRHLPITPEVDDILAKQTQLLETYQKRVRILQNTRDMLHKNITLTKEWYKHLQTISQSAGHKERQRALSDLMSQLRHTQQLWMQQLEQFNTQMHVGETLASELPVTDSILMLQTIATEEQNNATHIQLDLERTGNELRALREQLSREPPLMVLNTLQKPLETIANYLQTMSELLHKKCNFLKDSLQLFSRESALLSTADHQKVKDVLDILQTCCHGYQQHIKQVYALNKQVQSAQNSFAQQLRTYLGSRQDLPGLDMWAWISIVEQLKEIPQLFAQRMIDLSNLVVSIVKQASWMQSGFAGLISLAWMQILIVLRRFTKKRRLILSNEDLNSNQGISLFGFWIKLLHRNTYSLMLCMWVWSVSVIWKIPLGAFFGLFSLLSTHITFSILIHTCRFWLVDRLSLEKRVANKKLYYWFYGILSAGRIITLFSLIVHQLVLDYEVRNLVARLFMLFLFIIALILFRLWVLVPRLLEGYWVKRRRYIKQVVRWLSFLLPAALLLNAILGLVGYVQLAWAIVGYQSVLLLALCIYPFIKGLLNELFSFLSEQSIRRFRNGWLWSEALLKPLYQVLKLFTLVAIIVLLFSVVGWRDELLTWSTYPTRWFNKPLISIFDTTINTWKIIQAGAMSIFVAWLMRWSREFAYRWIFANLKDLGLRNSLSVFTQYMAIFLSILATLQTVGITLSVLKYILSGFAIGLSFGLRDLFNNFVTGILLLVERPLKVGDWVTVGEHDGQVIYIGARSITVNTEDHQELMVPNADLFYKHFINWTRNDTIVRITLPLFINRQDNPIKVRELILEVIATVNKILNNPAPEVYFKATDQMLLSFKVEYYVDLTQITSRSEVNSQFLFALWKRFSEENISPPEIVHALYLKGQTGIDQSKRTTSTHE